MLEEYIQCCWLKYTRIWSGYRETWYTGGNVGVFSLHNLNQEIENYEN